MPAYHPGGDLAPRDVVARSIVREEEKTGGGVFLTLAHLDPAFVIRRFPTIAEMCRRVGLDLARDPIPVGPAAHYIMGGVETDEWARTSVPGLFAAGEVACTGVHGANRLASNSLLEGLVFGARAGLAMQEPPRGAMLRNGWIDATAMLDPSAASPPEPLTSDDVRDLMWRAAGLFRTRGALDDAVARLRRAYERERRGLRDAVGADIEGWQRFHLVTAACLIGRAALRREESRGGHFRADFPERDDRRWKVHLVDRRDPLQ
jgi:L-aspartate oxidase